MAVPVRQNLRLGAYLARHGISLVHAFDVPLDLFAVPVAKACRVPVVLSSQRAHRSSSACSRLQAAC